MFFDEPHYVLMLKCIDIAFVQHEGINDEYKDDMETQISTEQIHLHYVNRMFLLLSFHHGVRILSF